MRKMMNKNMKGMDLDALEKDPNTPNSQWVKYMHGINRLSLLLFVFAIIVMIVKLFVKK